MTMHKNTLNNFNRLNWITIVNIIIILLILSLLFIANDSLIIKLSYLWEKDLSQIIYINTNKLCSILSLSGNIGINIFTFLILIFNVEVFIINLFILLYQNYNVIIIILLSLWFTTTLTKNFYDKHLLKYNGDLISKFFYIFSKKNYIFIFLNLAVILLIVFISRIISRSAVWFLLEGVSYPLGSSSFLSFNLMILLSWPLLWYMVNIILKLLGLRQKTGSLDNSVQKLTSVDFEFCNPYVVEKVNLYAISLNLLINYLIAINLYWSIIFICILLCIFYFLIKYRYLLFFNKGPENSILVSTMPIWESLLTLGAVMSTGLSEFNWSEMTLSPIMAYVTHEEKWINKTFNSYSGNQKMKPSEAFGKLRHDKDLCRLRYQSRKLLYDHITYIHHGQYKHNTTFFTESFKGFSLNSHLKGSPNVLILFIRTFRDNSVKYVPSFFSDPGLQNVDKDLREKFGIYTHEPEKFDYLILFTQERKINDSLIKVWRPLPYSHMPFRGIQNHNYYHIDEQIERKDPSIICTENIVLNIKKLIDSHNYDNIKPEIVKIMYYYMLLAKEGRSTFESETSKGCNENNLRDSYIDYGDDDWPSDQNPNENLPLYKKTLAAMPLFDEIKASDKIFVGNFDKLDFEAYEMIKKKTGQELYSIIDTNNLLEWEQTGESGTKKFVLYKDYHNILNDKDNSSILNILKNQFRKGESFVVPSYKYT